jgi:hypothetical protein
MIQYRLNDEYACPFLPIGVEKMLTLDVLERCQGCPATLVKLLFPLQSRPLTPLHTLHGGVRNMKGEPKAHCQKYPAGQTYIEEADSEFV